jgi:hypothetical protein
MGAQKIKAPVSRAPNAAQQALSHAQGGRGDLLGAVLEPVLASLAASLRLRPAEVLGVASQEAVALPLLNGWAKFCGVLLEPVPQLDTAPSDIAGSNSGTGSDGGGSYGTARLPEAGVSGVANAGAAGGGARLQLLLPPQHAKAWMHRLVNGGAGDADSSEREAMLTLVHFLALRAAILGGWQQQQQQQLGGAAAAAAVAPSGSAGQAAPVLSPSTSPSSFHKPVNLDALQRLLDPKQPEGLLGRCKAELAALRAAAAAAAAAETVVMEATAAPPTAGAVHPSRPEMVIL